MINHNTQLSASVDFYDKLCTRMTTAGTEQKSHAGTQ